MKYIIISLILLTSSMLSFAQSTIGIYQIKSGYVAYELTGSTTGTKKLWWDDYGIKTRTEIQSTTTTKIMGIKQTSHTNTIEIKNGNTLWVIDKEKMTGQETSLEGLVDYSEFEKMSEREKEAFAEALLDSLGGEKLAPEMFLGCMCDVISLWGAKVWTCQSVPLKTETNVMGIKANETATEFKKDIPVPASKFEKMPGVSYTQQGNYMNMLNQLLDENSGEYPDEEEE